MHQVDVYISRHSRHVCADVATMALGALPLRRGFRLAKRALDARGGDLGALLEHVLRHKELPS